MQNRSVLDAVVVEPGVQQPLRMPTTLGSVIVAEFLFVRMDVENGMELGFHHGDQLGGGTSRVASRREVGGITLICITSPEKLRVAPSWIA